MISARVEDEDMRGTIPFLTAVLAVGLLAGSAGAQEAEMKKVGEALQKSVVQLRQGETGGGMFTGWAINQRGLVLTLWSNVFLQGPISWSGSVGGTGKAKLIGVHPTRNLALLELEGDSKAVPVELAGSGPAVGDPLYLCSTNFSGAQACSVASETAPVGYSEYFWAVPPKDTGGWGYTSLQPGTALVNLKGQLVGVSTYSLVNGKLAPRFMPVHDVRAEAFVAPSDRSVNHSLVRELLQLADDVQDVKKYGAGNAYAGGNYATACLMLALVEDPNNADIYKRLGMVAPKWVGSRLATPTLGRSLQLAPWAEGADKSYLELGQSLVADKSKRSDAIAVWVEGAAKYPTTAKLWEALAKAYFDNSEFFLAARAARLAGATFGSQAREMADIYDKSKLRLSDRETADLRQLEGSMTETLRKLVEEAEVGRKEGRPLMTEEGKRVFLGEKGVGKSGADSKGSRPDPTAGKTSKEVQESFVSTRLVLAMENVKGGRLKQAEEILEDLVANYPKAETTQMARDLLQLVKKQK